MAPEYAGDVVARFEDSESRQALLGDMVVRAQLHLADETTIQLVATLIGRGGKGLIQAALKDFRGALAKKAKDQEESGPSFERGDHVELAAELCSRLGTQTVHAEGAFYQYTPEQGIWAEVAEEKLWNIVATFAGIPANGRPLRLNVKDISGTVQVAERALKQRRFFESRKPGFLFANGFVVVEPEGVRVEEHSPDTRARQAYDFDFDPGAKCPRFESFLWQILRPNISYPLSVEHGERIMEGTRQQVAYILEFLGLALIGEAPRLAGRALIMLGDGANGKSTLSEVIEAIFPPGAVSGVSPHDWTNDQKVALLVGKRLNIVGELPSRDLEQTDRFKGIMTGDVAITFKNVYERPAEFKATAGHWFNANQLPASGDGTHGFARRNVIIPLFRVFADHEQDRGLKAKLLDERAGIILLLLESAQRAVARGRICEVPETSQALLEEWKVKSDSVRFWLQRHCLLTWKFDTCRAETPAARMQSLYQSYSSWAKDDNRRGMTLATFEERVGSILRDAVRHDLGVLRQEEARGKDCLFKGFDEGAISDADRLAASAAFKQIESNGHLRKKSKVNGSSVRRLPILRLADLAEAELDASLEAI